MSFETADIDELDVFQIFQEGFSVLTRYSGKVTKEFIALLKFVFPQIEPINFDPELSAQLNVNIAYPFVSPCPQY